MTQFNYWCQKVLPLVYDESLSYYEVLCKVVNYINSQIDDDTQIIESIDELKKELAIVQKWIDNYDTSFAEEVIAKHLANMIYVNISDSGYIIYSVPQSWNDITFNTTGLDITDEELDTDFKYDYGRLVLSLYDVE